MSATKESQCKQKQAFEVIFCFHGAIFILVFFLCYKGVVRRQKVADALKTEEKKVLDFGLELLGCGLVLFKRFY